MNKIISFKKIIVLLLAVVAAFGFALGVTGCFGEPEYDKDRGREINIGVMSGATGLGIAKLGNRVSEQGPELTNDYSIDVLSQDGVTAGLINGDLDAAALPCNVAATLYNNPNIDIQVAAIGVQNVLYLVENGDSIKSLGDLAGKTVYLPGQRNTPDYTLRYLLAKNNITNVTIAHETEGTVIAAQMKSGIISLALLPQPAATVAVNGNPHSGRIVTEVDINEEWQKIDGNENTDIVTGVMVVRKGFLKNNKTTFDRFLSDYKKSVEFMINPANLDTAAAYAVDMNIIPALPIAKAALPKCGLCYIDGLSMQTKVNAYLTVLNGQDSEFIGGSIPKSDFYYSIA